MHSCRGGRSAARKPCHQGHCSLASVHSLTAVLCVQTRASARPPALTHGQATTISPWVVTPEALEPFRCEAPAQDPPPLPYLREAAGERWGYDLRLEVDLVPEGGQVGGTEGLVWLPAWQEGPWWVAVPCLAGSPRPGRPRPPGVLAVLQHCCLAHIPGFPWAF